MDDSKRSLAHRRVGLALLRDGKCEYAAKQLKRAAELDPKNAKRFYELGLALAEEEAIDAYREALRLDCGMDEAAVNVSVLLARRGKALEGISVLERVVREKLGEVDDWVGRMLSESGRFSREFLYCVANLLRLGGLYDMALESWRREVGGRVGMSMPVRLEAVDGEREDDGVAFCMVWWGSKYGVEYVENLYASLQRHFVKGMELRLYCLTDQTSSLPSGVIPISIEEFEFTTWWTKSLLFAPKLLSDVDVETPQNNIMIYIDLDTLIVDSIAPLIDEARTIVARGQIGLVPCERIQASEGRSTGYNSSCIVWSPKTSTPIHKVLHLLNNRHSELFHRFDHYLETIIDSHSIAPLTSITDYKSHTESRAPLVTFPLHPKPHDVVTTDPFVAHHWHKTPP